MTSLDIFHQDPFTSIQLTAAVEKYPYLPVGLGELNIFDEEPVRTKALAVEQRQGKLTLVPMSARGQPGLPRVSEVRSARYFDIPRLMHEDTIRADEIQSIRAFGQESEMLQVQTEVARRLSGPTGITKSIEFTWEYHRLAAIQGLLLDADGSVKFNWFNEFGITQAAEIGFNLPAGATTVTGTLRPLCNQIVRNMSRLSQGAFLPSTEVYALCGDTFWDQLTNHSDVKQTYINWAAAAELRKGNAFEAMRFGGINWFNYRGSDDTTTIAVPPDKCKFFPVGAPGVFRRGLAPYESFDFVNTLGKPMYVQPIIDRDRNAWWKMEVYSYPLHICTRPEVLLSGRSEA